MPRRSAELDRARERFLEGTEPGGSAVRAEIMASWQRSRRAGIDASRFEVPYVGDVDSDGSLAACAQPVLDDLAEKLSGMAVAVVLCDVDGNLLDRRVGEDGLRRRLDAISLAPGFSYAEQFAGTNGVGTALSDRAPALVVGAEHFTDLLQPFACAGAPVMHGDGTLAGILDVTCLRDQAGDLMRYLARQAAGDISEALRSRGSVGAAAVMTTFRATCARHPGPVLAVGTGGQDFLIANHAARTELTARDRDEIAERAGARPPTRHGHEERVLLSGGPARLLWTPVPSHRPPGVVVAVASSASTLRLAAGPASSVTARPAADRPLPGLAGVSPSWRASGAALRAAAAARWSVLVHGESGVGKTAAIRSVHLEQHPTASWVVVDAGESGAAPALAALTETVGDRPATVVVRGLEAPADRAATATALSALLDDAYASWWVVGVVSGELSGPGADVLAGFATSVRVEPLRRRPEDVAPLVEALLGRLAPARRARPTPAAAALLTGARWPGNAHELTEALRRALAARPAGDLEPVDLPAELAVHGTRRRLTPLETAERDVIVEALVEADGNRSQAAAALGMGRTTLYRRLRAFGLTDLGR